MALAAGDIITYDGSIWRNQPGVSSPFGIGITASFAPSAYLQINGANPSLALSTDPGSSPTVRGYIGAAGGNAVYSDFAVNGDFIVRAESGNLILTARNGSGGILFGTGASDTEKMRIASGGNVGIGTTNTGHRLQIRSGADDLNNGGAVRIEASDYGTNGGYLIINKNSGNATHASIQSGDNAAYRPLALNPSGGNVGIGTTTNVNSKLTFAADTVAAGGILFGTDTNLYRAAADTLKTDDGFVVGAPLTTAGTSATPTAGSTVTPSSSFITLSPSSAVTLSTTTAISDGAVAGQWLILKGTSDSNTVTVPNNANTKLGAARTLGVNDLLLLLWDGTDWLEIAFANNSA